MKLKNDQNEALLVEIEEKAKLIQDYTDSLKRLQADFENYVKRTDKEKQEYAKYASHKLLLKLLSITDDFEKAIKAIENTTDIEQLKQGLNIILTNLNKTLEEEGIKEIEALGKKADPYLHEILTIEPGEEDDKITREIQKGYKLHDKVLRTSKVIISKKKGETSAK